MVQLSTGSPQDARDTEAWALKRGTDYLDGAIMATPSQMGRPDTTIFVSGADSTFRKSESILKSLGGNVVYLGEQVGSASAFDGAVLSFYFGGIFGFLHGSLICESEGLRVDSFGTMVADIAPVLGEIIKRQGEIIQAGMYERPESSVRICAKAFELLVRQAGEARNVFSRAREIGGNTAVVGWYHPYCRVIGGDLTMCSSDTLASEVDWTGTVMASPKACLTIW